MFEVKTNNVPREIRTLGEFTPTQIYKSGLEEETLDTPVFEYKGHLHAIGEFLAITTHGEPSFTFHLPQDHPMVKKGWEAISQDGLGMVLKFAHGCSHVIVGWAKGV